MMEAVIQDQTVLVLQLLEEPLLPMLVTTTTVSQETLGVLI